jgi:hypothetical protein
MTDEPKQRDQARQDRLRAALRENLKRRKLQARGRSEAEAPEDGEDGNTPPRPMPDEG